MYQPVSHLLDLRAAKANAPSTFTIEDCDDSPSIYSHPAFSPRSHNNHHLPTLGSPLQSPTRSYFTSNRERLNDPALSSLDLDDDPRNSYVSGSHEHLELSGDASADEDESMSRMSLLGPKMRFHSPAPWELDDSPMIEEAEPTSSYLSAARNGVKKLGFSGVGVSTRSSNSSRPSNESARSQPSSKRSFEGPSSTSPHHGAPSYLRTTTPTPIQPSSVDPDFSPASRQARSSGGRSSKSHPPTGPLASPYGKEPRSSSRYRSTPLDEVDDHTTPRDSSAWPPDTYTRDTHRHPYATADAYFSESSPPPLTRGSSDLQPIGVSRSDSSFTITESSTISSTATKISPDSSLVGIRQKHTTVFHGKEISLPISMGPDANSRSPGWSERSMSPSFNLISLEEAQQQAKRTRSATVDGKAPTLMYQPSLSKPLAFPYSDGEGSLLMDTSPYARQRSRSISAGVRANAKNMLGTMKASPNPKIERRDSEPAPLTPTGGGKSLKHKKSGGFMRMFTSRDKDKDEVPPPVPSISGSFATSSLQQSAPEPALSHKPSIIASRRVPVPSIGLLIENSADPSTQGDPPSLETNSSQRPFPSSPSAKKTPPLSIDTSRSQTAFPSSSSQSNTRLDQGAHSVTASVIGKDGSWPGANRTALPPQSAPPAVTEFGAAALAPMPSLRLRPVSTTFSSQFGDRYMAKPSLTPALEEDLGITSPASTVSPITPGLHTRLHTEVKDMVKTPVQHDQSSLIHALQEQIVSAKLAWQRQIWELEGQVRDLKAEVEEARSQLGDGSHADFCETCGRGVPLQACSDIPPTLGKPHSVLNRPRARTGAGAHRFGTS